MASRPAADSVPQRSSEWIDERKTREKDMVELKTLIRGKLAGNGNGIEYSK
jgi:hypothetical protein